jgi:uncharacterized RDD family membrane protein YckC
MTKAGAWRRFGARLIDQLILVIPFAIIVRVIGGSWGVSAHEHHLARLFVGRLLATLMMFAYFVWMESQRGATLGKNAVGVGATAADGTRLTVDQAMRRNWWLLLGAIPLPIAQLVSLGVTIAIGITIANDADGRGFHDKWAGSIVRRTTATPS